jgi:hypothetical protein
MIWWPGTELNRRRQPFQSWVHPRPSIDFKQLTFQFPFQTPDLLEPKWSQQPKTVLSEFASPKSEVENQAVLKIKWEEPMQCRV